MSMASSTQNLEMRSDCKPVRNGINSGMQLADIYVYEEWRACRYLARMRCWKASLPEKIRSTLDCSSDLGTRSRDILLKSSCPTHRQREKFPKLYELMLSDVTLDTTVLAPESSFFLNQHISCFHLNLP